MRNILLATVLALSAAAACSTSESTPAAKAEVKIPEASVDDLDRMLAANEATPVDCNGPNTRKRVGYVPGAVLVTDEGTYAASELPADKARKLVFYCGGPD